MKAIVWQGPNEMTVEEQPHPDDPGPGELILRPEAVGICGSEVEGYLGHMGNRIAAAGHGARVRGRRSSRPARARQELDGARVAVNPLSGCGECRLCRAGHSNLCAGSRADRRARAGRVRGLREGAARPTRAVLPDGVSSRIGALMEPLANGVHAVRLAPEGVEARRRDRAPGRSGSSRCRPRCWTGIPHVAVVEPQDERRARALGARRPRRLRLARGGQGRRRAGPGARRGRRAGDAARSGWSCCGRAARWSASGSPTDDTTLGFHDVVRSQHRIQGSYAYTMPDFEQAHEWLVSGAGVARRRPRPPCGRSRTGPEAFARLAGGPPPPEFKIFLAGEGREA